MESAEYEALIRRCKERMDLLRGHAAAEAHERWAIADDLASVEVVNRGQNGHRDDEGIDLAQLAADLGVSKRWVTQLRRAAKRFPAGKRIDVLGPSVHLAALSTWKTADEALRRMRDHEGPLRVRDIVPDIADGEFVRMLRDEEAVARVARRLSTDERAAIERALAGRARRSTSARSDAVVLLGSLRRARSILDGVADRLDAPSDVVAREIAALDETVRRLHAKCSVAA